MAKITIAVPVYNEANLLRGSLACLRDQSFSDFEVLIYDNASTDETAIVAQEFCQADLRFKYFRQPENRGGLANYYDSLLAAKGEYFMWRAADDRSAANYLAELVRLLEERPDRKLAVGTVFSSNIDGSNLHATYFPRVFLGRAGLLYASHASWVYGLFRREALTQVMHRVMKIYAYPWAFDHLVLLPFLLEKSVVGTAKTFFNQNIKRVKSDGGSQKRSPAPDVSLMEELRRRFLTQAREYVTQIVPSGPSRVALSLLMWPYTGKRVYKFRKVLRRKYLSRPKTK